MNVTFAISSPAIEPSGRTDCTIERIGSGTNDLTVDGRNFTQSWGRKKRKATKASEEANHIRKSRHRMLLLNTLLLVSE